MNVYSPSEFVVVNEEPPFASTSSTLAPASGPSQSETTRPLTEMREFTPSQMLSTMFACVELQVQPAGSSKTGLPLGKLTRSPSDSGELKYSWDRTAPDHSGPLWLACGSRMMEIGIVTGTFV